jgi:hypothetical protein
MQRGDLGLDALGVPPQQVALLGRHRAAAPAAVGLVGAHVVDAQAECPQAGKHLQCVKVLVAVAAVPAPGVPVDRADQPDLLVIAQGGLAQPAAPGHLLDRHRCHAVSVTYLKRLKSSPVTSGNAGSTRSGSRPAPRWPGRAVLVTGNDSGKSPATAERKRC